MSSPCDEHCRNFCRLRSEITSIREIASGPGVDARSALAMHYGRGRWRKMKGVATIETLAGEIRRAEVHWYEAHGIGRREIKRKQFLD